MYARAQARDADTRGINLGVREPGARYQSQRQNPAGTGEAPIWIYSSRVLIRSSNEPGPYHNFPMSFDAQIFRGSRAVINDRYVFYRQPGTLNGVRVTYDIGVRPLNIGLHRNNKTPALWA